MAVKDLTGKKFGRLTVTSLHSTGKRTFWNVQCECGTEKKVEAYTLHIGRTTSCGCYQLESRHSRALKVAPGTRFSKLTVINELTPIALPCGQVNRIYLCRCDCGTETKVRHIHLIRNRIKSCGCISGEKHGMSKTKIYYVWRMMQERCHKPYTSERNIKNYYSRNIKVCQEWRNSFTVFYEWCLANGYNEGLQIDRINNNGNYEPSNCRFVTPMVNGINKRTNRSLEINGVTKTISEWSTLYGINYGTLWYRVQSKWPINRLLEPQKEGLPVVVLIDPEKKVIVVEKLNNVL